MKPTQGDILAQALKREPMTYLEMLSLCVSTAPWKRIGEWLDSHDSWKLVKGQRRGLVTWRIVRAR